MNATLWNHECYISLVASYTCGFGFEIKFHNYPNLTGIVKQEIFGYWDQNLPAHQENST